MDHFAFPMCPPIASRDARSSATISASPKPSGVPPPHASRPCEEPSPGLRASQRALPADALNRRGITTASGKRWHALQVLRARHHLGHVIEGGFISWAWSLGRRGGGTGSADEAVPREFLFAAMLRSCDPAQATDRDDVAAGAEIGPRKGGGGGRRGAD